MIQRPHIYIKKDPYMKEDEKEDEVKKDVIFTQKVSKKPKEFIRVKFEDMSQDATAGLDQESIVEVRTRSKKKEPGEEKEPEEKKEQKKAKGPSRRLFEATGLGRLEEREAPPVTVPRDPETGFPASFIKEVKNIFKQDAWNLTLEKNHIQAQEKVDTNPKQVDIIRNESNNEIKFSAKNGPTDELVQCLKAYETAMAPETELEYEITASSEEEAKAYVKKMHEQQINTGNIFSIRIGTRILNKEEDIQAFVKEALRPPSQMPKLK